jgi:hypothetical protein
MTQPNDVFAEAFSFDDTEEHAPVGVEGPEREPEPRPVPDTQGEPRLFRETHTIV